MTFGRSAGPFAYKFERQSLCSIKVSVSVYVAVLGVALSYTFLRMDTSWSEMRYQGMTKSTSPNTTDTLLMLPPPNYTNYFSIVFLEIVADSQEEFNIDADLSLQWYRMPSQLTIPIEFVTTSGVSRLFATGLFSYDALLSQIHVSGDVSLIKSIDVRYILGNPDFIEETIVVRLIMCFTSFLCLIVYLGCLFGFSKGKVRLEQILTVVSLVISILANCPIKFTYLLNRDWIIHCANLVLKGIFNSYNHAALFVFLYALNGGENLAFAMIMSMLFVCGNAAQVVVNDTRILALLFGANIDIWMFFLSISIMSRVGLFALQVYNLIIAVHVYKHSKPLIYGYAALIILGAAMNIWEATMYYVDGFGNYALDFLNDYVMQTFFAFVYADLHWPQPSSLRQISFMETTMVLDFPNIDEVDPSNQPDMQEFCM